MYGHIILGLQFIYDLFCIFISNLKVMESSEKVKLLLIEYDFMRKELLFYLTENPIHNKCYFTLESFLKKEEPKLDVYGMCYYDSQIERRLCIEANVTYLKKYLGKFISPACESC
jgi:hypothetical protein